MAKCKTEGCAKEAVEGSEYCAACKCEKDKKGKNIFKAVFGLALVVGAGIMAFMKSSDKA